LKGRGYRLISISKKGRREERRGEERREEGRKEGSVRSVPITLK
jgi:hypothetical protein